MAILTKKFSEFANGGDLPTDAITVGLGPGGNTQYNNPWTFLPPGTTGDRPVPVPAIYFRLRYNTSLDTYEYYDPDTMIWVGLSGSGTGTVLPGTVNDIPFYIENGTTLGAIDSAANSILVTNGSSAPSLSNTTPAGLNVASAIITASTAALTSGQVAAAPSASTDLTNKTYVDTLVNGTVLSITGTTNQVIASSPTGNVTLSLPQSIGTGSSPTFASLTLSSPLMGASGGSGVANTGTTFTRAGNVTFSGAFSFSGAVTANTNITFPTSGLLAAYDANNNLSANNFIPGYANTVTAAGTTTLTATSSQQQFFTGTTTQTVVLPVTSTLVLGFSYLIVNNSTGIVTVQSSGLDNVIAVAPSTQTRVTCILTSGTTATSWSADATASIAGVSSITGTANQITASSATGNVTLSLPANVQISNSILGGNGTTILGLAPQTSAVNYIDVYNAATGFPPQLVAAGADADIALYAVAKGNRPVTLFGAMGGTNPITVLSGTGYQHVTAFNFADTAASRAVTFPDASGTILFDTTLVSPTIQKFTSGSGTYTTPVNPAPLYIRVRMVGGGAGGGATGTSPGNPTAGGNTTFGTTLLVANGGAAGNGGAGGTGSLGTAIGLVMPGMNGGVAAQVSNSNGTDGGVTIFGGAGRGGQSASGGSPAIANSGAGGGGAGAIAAGPASYGGASGCSVDAIITSPAATYSYAVGAGGSGGTLGVGGSAGGAGAAGQIIVEEFYQ